VIVGVLALAWSGVLVRALRAPARL
jgi:hypothetical protein